MQIAQDFEGWQSQVLLAHKMASVPALPGCQSAMTYAL